MTVVEALKQKDQGVRLVAGDRWLIWHEHEKEWWVLQRTYCAKHTKMVCRDKNVKVALEFLLSKR